MANWVEVLDAQIASILADWSILTTFLAIVIAAIVAYPIIFPEDPDTHPLLLARQSINSPVRNKGESAVYRSPEGPPGYPLTTGLNVKEAGAPKWAAGKDGDLRDIWREVQKAGTTGADGKQIPKGRIMTVMGRDEVVEHDFEDLSKEINIIGQHLKVTGATKVGIYLPNSVEYLSTIFACAFYGMTPVLLPFNQPEAKLYELINTTGAGSLICAAGTLSLEDLAKECISVRRVTWVVEKTSRHMDWNGIPEGAEGRLSVSVWEDVVDQAKAKMSAELPVNEMGQTPTEVVTIWQPASPEAKPEIVTFNQQNMVSATAALISAIPLRQRMGPADLVLPADSFSNSYVLCQTFAALYTHASLAINSVAIPGVSLAMARRGVAPTIIIASAETLATLHQEETAKAPSLLQRFDKYSQSQAWASGRMPTDGILFRMTAPPASKNEPGKLRLILTSDRLGTRSPALTSSMLADLRIFTRSRITYALTAAKVAGAVAQTHIFDYRCDNGTGHAHFGIPLSCVEVKLINSNDADLAHSEPKGDLDVAGPSVSGDEVTLGATCAIREDGTVAYA